MPTCAGFLGERLKNRRLTLDRVTVFPQGPGDMLIAPREGYSFYRWRLSARGPGSSTGSSPRCRAQGWLPWLGGDLGPSPCARHSLPLAQAVFKHHGEEEGRGRKSEIGTTPPRHLSPPPLTWGCCFCKSRQSHSPSRCHEGPPVFRTCQSPCSSWARAGHGLLFVL